MEGRFETRVVDTYTTPSITFRYKHSTVKKYLKGGRALRTETTINDSYDLDTGQRLEHSIIDANPEEPPLSPDPRS